MQVRRKWLGAFLLAGLLLAGALWFPRDHSSDPGTREPSAISLGLSAEASTLAQGTTAFPESEAGLAAYLKLESLNVDKVIPLLGNVEGVGDNYAVGSRGTRRIYIDSTGWIVSYLPRGYAAAYMIDWNNVLLPDSGPMEIRATYLESDIQAVLKALDLPWGIAENKLGFYHFAYPKASHLQMAARRYGGRMQVLVPSSYQLYEASVTASGYGCSLRVDDQYFGATSEVMLEPGVLHSVQGSCGGQDVVLVLLYTPS